MRTPVPGARVAVATLVFALFAFTATTASADDDAAGTAEITVIANIEIEETEIIQFGTIGKPSDVATQTFTLDPATGDVDDSGGNGFSVGDSSAGVYEVTGNNDTQVFITSTIDPANFGAAGVELTDLDIEGSGDAHDFNLDGNGEGVINVGGTVDVDDDAEEGTHTATVTLTASYD